MASKIYANINIEILNWVIESSGFPIEELSKKSNISANTLEAAIRNEKKLTMNQLRRLSSKVKRPMAVFYLKNVPEDFRIPDFRKNKDEIGIPPNLRIKIRELHEKKENAIFLSEITGDKYNYEELDNLSLPKNPIEAGNQLRNYLGINIDELKKLRDHAVLNYWKDKLEALGIMIFQFSKVEPYITRGFSFPEKPLPLIAINQKDSTFARVFTLIHEFTHIILKNGGLCDSILHFGEENEIEKYCNEVASNTIMPINLLQEEIKRVEINYENIRDLVGSISKTYKTSWSVILIHLAELRKIDTYMKNILIEQLRTTRKDPEKQGGDFYKLFLSSNSKLYLKMIHTALNRDLITFSNVTKYLGTHFKVAGKIIDKMNS